MLFPTSTSALLAAVLSIITTTSAKPCADGGGECVNYFYDGSCTSAINNYVPTCEGNCFVASFAGIKVNGNFIEGTDCHVYSDTNCQDQILDTGNVNGDSDCYGVPGANSMKCYFDC